MDHLGQIIILLAMAVAVVLVFQRLRIPTSLGYLLVGVILGPYTIGPNVYVPEFRFIAEFGVVFLLFTIGLNYSLPQLAALRGQVLLLGSGQVVFTTLVVTLLVWLAGTPLTVAFVFGAVFAQSSTTIIGSVLAELGEDSSRHGRFGLAMSVFQDVTAVPFLVIIPVLGISTTAAALSGALGWALVKALLAFAAVFLVGRWLLRPLFHMVVWRRSAELFTLSVLMVALLAAWSTSSLGLSLAFGGFLAGMMIGETEFRHQVESTIRPFRDVLLGLFFVGIGMRFDPMAIPPIWHWVVLGALTIVLSKTLIVAVLAWRSGLDAVVSWRTGLLLSVGGEFGLALIAIALDATVIDGVLGQILISSVLLAMVLGAVLIRFNGAIAARLAGRRARAAHDTGADLVEVPAEHVVIGGYGRVGHTIAVLLQARGVPFIAFDSDPERIAQARADGHPVAYGDFADPELLASIRLDQAALVVVTLNQTETALAAVAYLARHYPGLPVVARARDLESSARLLEAGASHAHPDAIEASLHLGALALEVLAVPADEVGVLVQGVRETNYRTLREADVTP
ncbi:MAG: cation:proton antiporter [Pseudomonadales bacterium]|nr:cation:proton antiporter [Pseudomonadales bacterium]